MKLKLKKNLKVLFIVACGLICLSYVFYLIAKTYEKNLVAQLNDDWLSRTTLVADEDVPVIEWVEDSITSKGIDSFVCLDRNCDEIKYLVHTTWPILWNARYWWKSRLGGGIFIQTSKSSLRNIIVRKPIQVYIS